jgi:hypothetical protein
VLQWLIDIAKTSSDAVPAVATGTRFARGLALMDFLVHRYTVPMVLMAVLVIGVVIPTAAGATIAELCPGAEGSTMAKKLPNPIDVREVVAFERAG